MNTITAHGRTWPLAQRRAYIVSAETELESRYNAEKKAAQLRRLGLRAKVQRVNINEMSPEDQAEKETLDAESVEKAK